jgi:hypothetical protein
VYRCTAIYVSRLLEKCSVLCASGVGYSNLASANGQRQRSRNIRSGCLGRDPLWIPEERCRGEIGASREERAGELSGTIPISLGRRVRPPRNIEQAPDNTHFVQDYSRCEETAQLSRQARRLALEGDSLRQQNGFLSMAFVGFENGISPKCSDPCSEVRRL